MSERDSHRSEVYEAENLLARLLDRALEYPVAEIAGSRVALPVERKFASLTSVQSYVDRVLALAWVRRKWPRAALPVFVRERGSAAKSHYERAPAIIALPTHRANQAWALREVVILHELAHHLDGTGDPPHGPAFLAILLDLVGEIIGPEAGFILRVTLADTGAL